jgi:hypothetical protein
MKRPTPRPLLYRNSMQTLSFGAGLCPQPDERLDTTITRAGRAIQTYKPLPPRVQITWEADARAAGPALVATPLANVGPPCL